MAPKRQKNQQGGPSNPLSSRAYDANWFLSFEHQQRFINNSLERKIIREKGLSFQGAEVQEVQFEVERREWKELMLPS